MLKNQAVGLIETVGLVTAISALDGAVKAANVEVIGYESARGDGLITVKVSGEISAVKTAISAGKLAAQRVGEVRSVSVIPKVFDELKKIILSSDTVGAKNKKTEISENKNMPEIEENLKLDNFDETKQLKKDLKNKKEKRSSKKLETDKSAEKMIK